MHLPASSSYLLQLCLFGPSDEEGLTSSHAIGEGWERGKLQDGATSSDMSLHTAPLEAPGPSRGCFLGLCHGHSLTLVGERRGDANLSVSHSAHTPLLYNI